MMVQLAYKKIPEAEMISKRSCSASAWTNLANGDDIGDDDENDVFDEEDNEAPPQLSDLEEAQENSAAHQPADQKMGKKDSHLVKP